MRETIEAKEAATILGLSEWTVYDLARRRVLPHVRVGRRVLFRRTSILAWLEAQEVASVAAPAVESGRIRRLK
ncbi:MAG: helix-turn-helix domain-containing protein [Peptococcaceae bacterium]|nr:helix-turn-helix domain-containing protein [Peptococcaceae bacterium]